MRDPPSIAVVTKPNLLEAETRMLDTRVSRVDKLEHAAPPPPVWSCAASCLTSYSCKTNGENTVEWTQKTGVGTTAAEAFLAMTAKCDATVFVDGRCVDGTFVRTQATIVNACVKN